MTTPRIAIAGAGIGGLTCARVLQLHGFDVTVFERESSPDARQQGGTIDLHADSGQEALHATGLYEQWRALARFEGQEQRVVDHSTVALIDYQPPDGDFRPEIDRGQLRNLLLGSLRPGTVTWGLGIASAAPGGSVTFLDGSTADFDLVVGADGAWSRVRGAVSGAVPEYTGVMFIETQHDNDVALLDLVGLGTLSAQNEGLLMYAQRNSGNHIRAYAGVRTREDWKPSNDELLDLYADWHPDLKPLLTGELIYRPLYALPVPHLWETTPGVTLLGDAAHLMPPLGVGANLAMVDAAELALAIAERGVHEGVRAYESVMLPRSAEFAEHTRIGLQQMVPERAAHV